MGHRHRRAAAAVAAMSTGLLVGAALPAHAATVIDSGHVDLEVVVDCATSTVEFEVHSEETGQHYDPADVELVADSASWTLGGSAEQTVFGTSDVATLPEQETSGIVFPGFGLAVENGTCVSGADIILSAANSTTPTTGARAAAYNATGSPVYLDTTGGGSGLSISGHTHTRWGFTTPGSYSLVLTAETAVGSSDPEAFAFTVEQP